MSPDHATLPYHFNLVSSILFQLLQFGRSVLGKRLFEAMMRSSFYGQFVAGVDEEDIKPAMRRNLGWGIKSILDYSVEKDLTKEEATEAEME